MSINHPSRMTSAKLIALGTVLDLIAASVAIAIWQSKPRGGFLQVPGWCTIIVAAIGAALLAAGIIKRDDATSAPGQTQIGGDHSANYQAGGNIRISDADQGDR